MPDDNFDNRDDNCCLNHHRYNAETSSSCLVTYSACSWQSGAQGSLFIRSKSATPFGLCALKPLDESSSSSSTSTNVSLLTSRQLHTRTVLFDSHRCAMANDGTAAKVSWPASKYLNRSSTSAVVAVTQ